MDAKPTKKCRETEMKKVRERETNRETMRMFPTNSSIEEKRTQ